MNTFLKLTANGIAKLAPGAASGNPPRGGCRCVQCFGEIDLHNHIFSGNFHALARVPEKSWKRRLGANLQLVLVVCSSASGSSVYELERAEQVAYNVVVLLRVNLLLRGVV